MPTRKSTFDLRHTFELVDAVERDNGLNTYDFELTDDLNMEVPGVQYEPANVGGWIMFDVSNN